MLETLPFCNQDMIRMFYVFNIDNVNNILECSKMLLFTLQSNIYNICFVPDSRQIFSAFVLNSLDKAL